MSSPLVRLSKRAAIDADNDTSSGSDKQRRVSETSLALNKIGDGITASNDIAHADLTQRQQRQQPRNTTPERRQRAFSELQRLNPNWTPDELVAMIDLFRTDPAAGDTFLSIEQEDIRSLWVRKQLAVLGYR